MKILLQISLDGLFADQRNVTLQSKEAFGKIELGKPLVMCKIWPLATIFYVMSKREGDEFQNKDLACLLQAVVNEYDNSKD